MITDILNLLNNADKLTREELAELNNNGASDNQKKILALTLAEIGGAINDLMEYQEKEKTMSTHISKQDMLNAALGEFADFGFRLEEPDDHITVLYFKDKLIARYNQPMLTIPVLHEGCRNYLKSLEP